MAESSVRRASIVEQLLKKPSPQHEPEVEEAIEAFQEARARSREATMLDFRMRDGTIDSFPYSYLTRSKFTPEDRITIRFGRDMVRVTGRNLYRIYEAVTEHRIRFIQEGAEGEEATKPVDAPHVEEIEILEEEEA